MRIESVSLIRKKRISKCSSIEQIGNERAAKLGAFHHHLGRESTADEFKLAGLVSKLDEQDRQWAMKQTDIELLRKYAVEKAAECRDNAGRCVRSAEEVGFKIFG